MYFLIFLLILFRCNADTEVEEFRVAGPGDLQSIALKTYLDARRQDPSMKRELGDPESPLMIKAKQYAIDRNEYRPDDQMLLKRSKHDKTLLQTLPAPDAASLTTTDSALFASISSHTAGRISNGTNNAVVSQEYISALSVAVNEDIGLGALARAGAIQLGSEGQWISYAEEHIKKQNKMTHSDLMFHLGSMAVEQQTLVLGGLNETLERDLYHNLKEWAEELGANIRFTTPYYSKEKGGIRLVTTERIGGEETILKIPLKLIMCRSTARNVLVRRSHKYLGQELSKTFEKSDKWGLVLFLLHEYFKEFNGDGSRWGPFIRTLNMRMLTTKVQRELTNTQAIPIHKKWLKEASELHFWTQEAQGPCGATSMVCTTKPNERFPDHKFDLHLIRWAIWVVEQNAVQIKQQSTGLEFYGLVPFWNMIDKRVDKKGGIIFELDGSISIKTGVDLVAGNVFSSSVGPLTDQDFFMKYLSLPVRPPDMTDEAQLVLTKHKRKRVMEESGGDDGGERRDLLYEGPEFRANQILEENENNYIQLVLPGVLPHGHFLHKCVVGGLLNDQQFRQECAQSNVKAEGLMWKSAELKRWRQEMNLPPRLQDLRVHATRLHLYGDTLTEMERLNQANSLIAGLPFKETDMPAEEQMMLLGMARTPAEAQRKIGLPNTVQTVDIDKDGIGSENCNDNLDLDDIIDIDMIKPQLYDAADPNDDPEAKRAMENLAALAAQAQISVTSGNIGYNATQNVISSIRRFFQYGILPAGGLDELDHFLLKKIGMLYHCGTDIDMKITHANVSDHLWCSMRVHLMNETEMNVFCPAESRVFEENCQNVEFDNFTAISIENELNVISAFRDSLTSLLIGFNTTLIDDQELIRVNGYKELGYSDGKESARYGPFLTSAIILRMREKSLILKTLSYLEKYELDIKSGKVSFQLDWKRNERNLVDAYELEKAEYLQEIKRKANISAPIAIVPVDLENKNGLMVNLTLYEGQDLIAVVVQFCKEHFISDQTSKNALESALRERVGRISTPASTLILGVVGPDGIRRILGIPYGSNYTVETSVFCAKYGLSGISKLIKKKYYGLDDLGGGRVNLDQCERLMSIVKQRLDPDIKKYERKILAVVPVDAIDGRKLKLAVFEGEQHNILQLSEDFLALYKMDTGNAFGFATEVNRRLPNPVLQIPVALNNQRQVTMRLCADDNITNVIEAFSEYYETQSAIIELRKRAEYGMKPGSYMV